MTDAERQLVELLADLAWEAIERGEYAAPAEPRTLPERPAASPAVTPGRDAA